MQAREDLLNFIIKNDILDVSLIQDMNEIMRNKRIIEEHPYSIWYGKDEYWHTYILGEDGKRVHVKRKNEEDVKRIIVDNVKKHETLVTIKDIFYEWNKRKLGLGKISKATYDRNEYIFNRHYSEIQNQDIRTVTEDQLTDFLEEQVFVHSLKAKAFSNLKCVTRGMFKYAHKKKYISFFIDYVLTEVDISENDFAKEIIEDYQQVFMDDELNTIIPYLTENCDMHNLGILLMLIGGIRVGELATLKFSDMIMEGKGINIRRTETRFKDDDGITQYKVKDFPKTSASVRTVMIPDGYSWIYDKLKEYNPDEEYIFVKNGERMTTNTFRHRMYRVCKKLDIYKKSPHKARKTYGSILLDNNVDKQTVKDQMGHVDILVTETHYHRNRKKLEQKQAIVSNLPEFTKIATS